MTSFNRANAGRRAPALVHRIPDPNPGAGLIFADKVAIAMLLAGLAVLVYLWTLAAIAAGTLGADHLLANGMGGFGLRCEIALAAPAWLALRGVDLAKGGPWKRRKPATVRRR